LTSSPSQTVQDNPMELRTNIRSPSRLRATAEMMTCCVW